jgi:hypothetical protein
MVHPLLVPSRNMLINVAFASSAGSGGPIEACHSGNGLSELGKELIYELNRLGSKSPFSILG